MASINRLAIRGVRSFSPNDEEQFIEFSFPCTVIVGANGCGKTTIIESLKYAVAGAFPPGGGKGGQTFVHDPRAICKDMVKAQVKLRFTSKSGQLMVVVRSMELTQKKSSVTFKQLDGTLRSMDKDTGKRISLSHKCGELDKIIPQLLGVSKSILEHVLFCHQEDSSWPLSESAVLKKRFDDIFDSTRYTKAIETFRKTEKDLHATAKDLNADVQALKAHRLAASGFRKELAEQNEQLEGLDQDKKKVNQEMADLDAKIDALTEIIDAMDEIQTESNNYNQQRKHTCEMVKKQRQMLDKDLTQDHQLPELKEMLRDFDEKITSDIDRLQELKDRKQRLENSIAELQKQEHNLGADRARFEAEKEAHQGHCRERYAKMESMAVTYSMDLSNHVSQANASVMDVSFSASQSTALGGGGASASAEHALTMAMSISDEDMQTFFNTIHMKEQELKAELEKTKSMHQAEEDKLTTQLAELEAKKLTVQNERAKLEKKREEWNVEVKTLNTQLEGLPRIKKNEIEELRRQATRLAHERDEASRNPRRTQVQTEIRQTEDKVHAVKRQIEDDRMVLEQLRHCAESQNAIMVLKDQCRSDMENLQESIAEKGHQLQQFDINMELFPDEDINGNDGSGLQDYVEGKHDEVLQLHASRKEELEAANKALAVTQRVVSEKTAVVGSKQQRQAVIEAKLNRLNGADGSVSRAKIIIKKLHDHETELKNNPPPLDSSPQVVIHYLDERLKAIEEESPVNMDVKMTKKVLKKISKMLFVHDPNDATKKLTCCPCCDRFITDVEGIAKFDEKMTWLMQESSLVHVDDTELQEFNTLESNYNKWRSAISDLSEDVRDFQRMTEETKVLEQEIQEARDELRAAQLMQAQQIEQAKKLQSEVDELRNLHDTTKRWAYDASRIKEKRMQIGQKNLDLSISEAGAGRDLRTVEREMAARMEEKDSHMNNINRLNKEMTSLNNTIASLSTQASNMEKNVRDKEVKYAESEKATERRSALKDKLTQLTAEDSKLQDQLAPFTRRIDAKTREKDRTRSLKDSEVSSRQNALLEFQSDARELQRLTKAVDEFSSSTKPQELERIINQMSNVLAQIKKKREEVEAIGPELENARAAVQDQARHKKMLRENIDVMESEVAIVEYAARIQQLQEKLASVEGGETASDELQRATSAKEKRVAEKNRLEGRWLEIVEKIRTLKRKLSTDDYKDVDEQFRSANIKYHTTLLAAEDVKKYWTAVDKALLQFHAVKIKEINKIIKELWMLTYKGEDIQSIEIVSGEEGANKAARSYNYRVVMTKGSSSIDMRGRCSAGQRVLASIVIRLALAETFGVNCGCIALDEPTVNLDYKNKKGLAVALAQIISSRSQQQNFQAILITHDEDFVSMLKTEMSSITTFSMPEVFWRVYREMANDGKFYSKTKAVDWSDVG